MFFLKTYKNTEMFLAKTYENTEMLAICGMGWGNG